MVPLDAVIQDCHHHVFACVASLPGPHNVHVRLAVIVIIIAVLQKEDRDDEGVDDDSENYNYQHEGKMDDFFCCCYFYALSRPPEVHPLKFNPSMTDRSQEFCLHRWW